LLFEVFVFLSNVYNDALTFAGKHLKTNWYLYGTRIMNILVLVPSLYDTAPGQRFRIEQWARYLEPEGFRFTFLSFEDHELHDILYQYGRYGRKAFFVMRAALRRLKELAHLSDYDAVFLYREAAIIGPAILERWIASRKIPFVYDFDDPIWLPYRSPTNSFFSRFKFPGKTASICKIANAVIVGNSLLEKYASKYARNVYVVPTTIDMRRYPPKPVRSRDTTVTLGWSGSHSTLPFLELIHRPLSQVALRYRTRLLVISHSDTYSPDGFTGEVVARRWQSDTEAIDLHDIDIGLAPFPNTGWSPWRCHGKILQYMAVGIPTVASPVGIVPNYIDDGESGFLADSQEDWVEQLSRLIADPDLRQRIGLKARKVIEERYSAEVWAPKVGEILSSL